MVWQGDMGMGESWGKKIPDWENAKFKFWKICMESSRMRKKKSQMAIGLKVLYVTVRARWCIVLLKSSVS